MDFQHVLVWALLPITCTVSAAFAGETWFRNDERYLYNYRGSTNLQLDSAVDPPSVISVEGQVEVHPLSGCRRLFKVKNFHLLESTFDGTKLENKHADQYIRLEHAMAQHDVVFRAENGGLGTTLLVHPGESAETLNIKRAIISLLQRPLDEVQRVKQHSFRGMCDSSLTWSKKVSSTIARTEVMLEECAGSRAVLQIIPLLHLQQTTHVTPAQVMLSWRGRQVCEHEVNNHHMITEVNCHEAVTVRSDIMTDAVTIHSRQSLDLVERHPAELGQFEGHFLSRPLKYEVSRDQDQPSTGPRNITKALLDLKMAMERETISATPVLFRRLTHALASLERAGLIQITQKIYECWYCNGSDGAVLQKLLTDGLVACGTPACQEVLAQSLLANAVPPGRAEALMFTVATTQTLDRTSLSAFIDMCRTLKRPNCILPVSIMAARYTSLRGLGPTPKCPVRRMLSELKRIIGSECRQTSENKNAADLKREHTNLLTALKALANIGGSTIESYDADVASGQQVARALVSCVVNNAVQHQRIAAAAAQALETSALKPSAERRLWTLLQDPRGGVKVRASVFRLLFRQGAETAVRQAIRTIQAEPVRQRKLYETSVIHDLINDTRVRNSRRVMLQRLIAEENVILQSPLPTSQTLSQVQRLCENASSSDCQGGIGLEVTYNPAGLLPSSATIDLNADAFGHQVNLMRLAIDQTGRDDSPSTTPTGSTSHSDIVTKLKELYKFVQAGNSNTDATVSLTVFGYHVGFVNIDDLSFLSDLQKIKSESDLWEVLRYPNQSVFSILNDGVTLSIDKATHITLLREVAMTLVGLPLNLTLEATGVVQGKFRASLTNGTSLPQESDDLDNISIAAHLTTRGAGDVVTNVQVGLRGFLSTGVRHTSQWTLTVDTPLLLAPGPSGINLHMSRIPALTDLLNITTELSWNNGTHPVTPIRPAKDSCIWEPLESVTGWHLCHRPVLKPDRALLNALGRLAGEVRPRVPRSVRDFAQDVIFLNNDVLGVSLSRPSPVRTHSPGWFAYANDMWQWMWSRASVVPHSYTAMVFGPGHVTTYDGRSFDLPGYRTERCAYLLTRDVVDNNFIILQTNRSIIVSTKYITVRIYQGGKIKLNNSDGESDLPVESWGGHVAITRRGPLVLLSTMFGLAVRCDTHHALCQINVSGHYHNRTIGLFGTNDNEATNDFVKRDGTMASSVNDFVISHEISGRPECRPDGTEPHVRRLRRNCPSQLTQQCRRLFSSANSPLSSGFAKVNPAAFKEACVLGVNECYVNDPERRGRLCSVTAAYSAACRRQGTSINPSIVCASCNQRPLGTTWIQEVHRKVDIVLVTSLRTGSGTARGEYAKSLLRQVQKVLKSTPEGDSVRVGIVRYGGRNILSQAHMHTFHGELFENLQNQARIFTKLATARENGAIVSDGMDALQLVTEYAFRPEAVRVVFLLPGDVREDSAVSEASVRATRTRLANQDIILNVVSVYDIQDPTRTVGLQWDGTIIENERDSLINRRHLPVPHGAYGELVRATKGAFFDRRSLVNHNRHVIGETVINQISSEVGLCRRCMCTTGQTHQSTVTCRSTVC